MLRSLRKAFFENLSLKLFAIVLAITLYRFVKVDQDRSSVVAVKLLLKYPKGFIQVSKEVPANLMVTVRGPESQLRGVDRSVLRYSLDLSGVKQGVEIQKRLDTANIQALFPSDVQVIRITPPSISVHLKRLERRFLPVGVTLRGQAALGYTLILPLQPYPAKVQVEGPLAALRKLDEIVTEPIDLAGMRANTSRSVKLRAHKDVRFLSEHSVSVKLSFRQIQSRKEFKNIPIEIRNFRNPNMRARVSPGYVDVLMVGPLAQLDPLSQKDIKAYVDARRFQQRKPGTYNVTVKVRHPAPDSTVRKDTGQVDLILEKLPEFQSSDEPTSDANEPDSSAPEVDEPRKIRLKKSRKPKKGKKWRKRRKVKLARRRRKRQRTKPLESEQVEPRTSAVRPSPERSKKEPRGKKRSAPPTRSPKRKIEPDSKKRSKDSNKKSKESTRREKESKKKGKSKKTREPSKGRRKPPGHSEKPAPRRKKTSLLGGKATKQLARLLQQAPPARRPIPVPSEEQTKPNPSLRQALQKLSVQHHPHKTASLRPKALEKARWRSGKPIAKHQRLRLPRFANIAPSQGRQPRRKLVRIFLEQDTSSDAKKNTVPPNQKPKQRVVPSARIHWIPGPLPHPQTRKEYLLYGDVFLKLNPSSQANIPNGAALAPLSPPRDVPKRLRIYLKWSKRTTSQKGVSKAKPRGKEKSKSVPTPRQIQAKQNSKKKTLAKPTRIKKSKPNTPKGPTRSRVPQPTTRTKPSTNRVNKE